MSRPRTPTAILEAKGSFKTHANRRRGGEPVQKEPIGNAPKDLTDVETVEWKQLVKDCCPGVLTAADRNTVKMVARLQCEYDRDLSDMQTSKLALLNKLYGQLGMTPSDRARLSIAPAKKEVNRFDRFNT